ncbi:hypothetical protein WS67_17450 [Burkholderia singularis]|uniref:Uncharacterized protein n=1 Tax=Burkholderia singularis TaxID=1503053 RepID=A0A103E0G4_9BURK|nr:hypothetical protein WS67_17450 [Burkholderia singularis]
MMQWSDFSICVVHATARASAKSRPWRDAVDARPSSPRMKRGAQALRRELGRLISSMEGRSNVFAFMQPFAAFKFAAAQASPARGRTGGIEEQPSPPEHDQQAQ